MITAAQWVADFQTTPDDYLLLRTIDEQIARSDEARIRARKRGLHLVARTAVIDAASSVKSCVTKMKGAAFRHLRLVPAPVCSTPPSPRLPKDALNDRMDETNIKDSRVNVEDEYDDLDDDDHFDPPFGSSVVSGYASKNPILRSAWAW